MRMMINTLPRIPRGLKQAGKLANVFKTNSTTIGAPVDERVRFRAPEYYQTVDRNIVGLLDAGRLMRDGYRIAAPVGSEDEVDFKGEYEAHERRDFEVVDEKGRVVFEGKVDSHLTFIEPRQNQVVEGRSLDEATLVDMQIEVRKPDHKSFAFIENDSGKVWHGYGDTKAEAWLSLAKNYIESLELNRKGGIPRGDWVSYTQGDFREVNET